MDISYLLWLQEIREAAAPWVEHLFELVSLAVPLLLAIPFALYWCFDKRRGIFVLGCFAMGSLITETTKNVVCCYRPWVRDVRVHPSQGALSGATGYSFPSGHTTIAAATLGGVAWLWRKRMGVVIACIAGALLVGFSRNFLGVHTPQDVLAGLVVGVIAVVLVNLVDRWFHADGKAGDERGNHRDVAVLLSGLGLCVVAGFTVMLASHPIDYDASGTILVDPAQMRADAFSAFGYVSALLSGWFVERRWVRFSVAREECGKHEKGARVITSALLIGLAMLIVLPLLKGALVGATAGAGTYFYEFLKGFFPIICGVLVGPALAKGLFGAKKSRPAQQ